MSKTTETSTIWLFYLHVAVLVVGGLNIVVAAYFFEGTLLLLFIPESVVLLLILMKVFRLLRKENAL